MSSEVMPSTLPLYRMPSAGSDVSTMVSATENVPAPSLSSAQAALGMRPRQSAAASRRAHARRMTPAGMIVCSFTVFLLLSSVASQKRDSKTKGCAALAIRGGRAARIRYADKPRAFLPSGLRSR